ncbi:MAG: ATP-binding cassette domain-containing protein, partial [Pseudomonadales bacterium]|nr:ATP-binding cassette domain-containing protein [Pseudomonadales bacterium]
KTAAVHARSPFRFSFRDPEKMSSPLAEAEDLALGYRDEAGAVVARVLDGVEYQIEGGARIGLLGPNGAGKSTFIRSLAKGLDPLEGEIVRGHHAPVAWFAQHQMELLRPNASPIEHLREIDAGATEQALRNHLGGFGFGATAQDAVRYFSGGERARVVLALLAWQRPALLLLDEPTNHLDIEMREALALALGEFTGAVVLVSHDRHLLRETCDEFWLVAQGRVRGWDGDLDDYARWLFEQDAEIDPEPAAGDAGEAVVQNTTRADRQASKRAAAERRKALKPLKDEIARLEQVMEVAQSRLAELERLLADEALYEEAQREKMKQLLQEQGERRAELERAEEDWLHESARYEAQAQGDDVR